jgi:hypothetical protein
VGYVMLIAIA